MVKCYRFGKKRNKLKTLICFYNLKAHWISNIWKCTNLLGCHSRPGVMYKEEIDCISLISSCVCCWFVAVLVMQQIWPLLLCWKRIFINSSCQHEINSAMGKRVLHHSNICTQPNHIHGLYVSSFIYLFGTGTTTHFQPNTTDLCQNYIKVVQRIFLSKWVLQFQWENKASNWCTVDSIWAMLSSQRTNDISLIKDKKWEEKWWLRILTFHNDFFCVLHLG